MAKKTHEKVISQLKERLGRMTIPVLYAHIVTLDEGDRQKIIHSLSLERFKLLVSHEYTYKKLTTGIWTSNIAIEKNLLDAITPKHLLYIGSKEMSNNHEWGYWKYFKDEYLQQPPTLCDGLAEYFFLCSPDRIASILSFFIKSTAGVTAPHHEKMRDLFKYVEGRQFPFETVHLLSSIHPKVLFPALNKVSLDVLKRLFWLTSKMQGENNTIENVFADSYNGENKAYIDGLVKEAIIEEVSLLHNKQAYLLMKECTEDTQCAMTKVLGKDRLFSMKQEKLLLRSIRIDPSINLEAKVVSSDFELRTLSESKNGINRIHPRKVLRLVAASIQ